MPDLKFNYALVDHGTHIALHEIGYRDGAAIAMKATPVTFTADSGDKDILVAEMALALARALDLAPIAVTDLVVHAETSAH